MCRCISDVKSFGFLSSLLGSLLIFLITFLLEYRQAISATCPGLGIIVFIHNMDIYQLIWIFSIPSVFKHTQVEVDAQFQGKLYFIIFITFHS
jgi:hypothetical protein